MAALAGTTDNNGEHNTEARKDHTSIPGGAAEADDPADDAQQEGAPGTRTEEARHKGQHHHDNTVDDEKTTKPALAITKAKAEVESKQKRKAPVSLQNLGDRVDSNPKTPVLPGPSPPPSPPGQRKLRLSPRGSSARKPPPPPHGQGGGSMRRRSEFLREQRQHAFSAAAHRDRRASSARLPAAIAQHPPVRVYLQGLAFVYELARQRGAPPIPAGPPLPHVLDVRPLTRSPSPKVRHLCLGVKQSLGLEHDADFRLFLEKTNGDGRTMRPLRDEMSIASLRAELEAASAAQACRVVWAQYLFLPGDGFDLEAGMADSPRSAAHFLAYSAAKRHVALENYSVTIPMRRRLLALLLQGERGDLDGDDGQQADNTPTYTWYCSTFRLTDPSTMPPQAQAKLIASLKTEWRELAGMSKIQAQKKFLSLLKSECPQFGASFFSAKFRVKSAVPFFFTKGTSAQELLGEVTVGVNHSGIHIIDGSSGWKNGVTHINELVKWTTSVDGSIFCYAQQAQDEDAKTIFIYLTELLDGSGRQIKDLVEGYISCAELRRLNRTRRTSRMFEEPQSALRHLHPTTPEIKEGSEDEENTRADAATAATAATALVTQQLQQQQAAHALWKAETLATVRTLERSLQEKTGQVDSLQATVERLRGANAEQQTDAGEKIAALEAKAEEATANALASANSVKTEQTGRRRVAQELREAVKEVAELRLRLKSEGESAAEEALAKVRTLERLLREKTGQVGSLQATVELLRGANAEQQAEAAEKIAALEAKAEEAAANASAPSLVPANNVEAHEQIARELRAELQALRRRLKSADEKLVTEATSHLHAYKILDRHVCYFYFFSLFFLTSGGAPSSDAKQCAFVKNILLFFCRRSLLNTNARVAASLRSAVGMLEWAEQQSSPARSNVVLRSMDGPFRAAELQLSAAEQSVAELDEMSPHKTFPHLRG